MRASRVCAAVIIGLALGGCSKAPLTAAAVTVPALTVRAAQNQVEVVASTPACQVGADCALTFEVTARGDTHVNQEYPHRFTVDKAVASTHGDAVAMRYEDEQHAQLTVPFVQGAAQAQHSGTLAVSVCNDAECFIEKVRIDMEQPAKQPPQPPM